MPCVPCAVCVCVLCVCVPFVCVYMLCVLCVWCVLCVLHVLCYFVMCQVASVGAKNVCLAIKEMMTKETMTKEMMDCFTGRVFLAYYFNFLTLVFFLIMFRLSTSFQHTI